MKLVIVDDDPLVALSLKTILEAQPEMTVAALGGSGSEAVALFETHRPDVLLMDIRMEGMSGLEAAAKILEAHPDARILLLTTFSDDEYIVRALRIGAKGYILKQAFEGIAPAITAVFSGQTVFGEEIMEKLPSLMQTPVRNSPEDYGLNEKELAIIRLVADGQNNREIAGALYLGEGTVRNYISTILEKLGLRDRTQLACFYYKRLS
ncbi:MAG: response regulator transcription factor [Lachnospiraceae bacterium]|nr:response regulator transcription factor [Lachnospiraceae bacterium]